MRNKVIYAVTVPDSLTFLQGQLKYLANQGYEVKAICSDGTGIAEFKEAEGVDVQLLDMEREISLIKDAKSLFNCIRLIRKEKPDIINVSTPKASLVVMLAAYFCNVPIRVYTVRGLRMETAVGMKKRILLTVEKITAGAATHCLAVSPSLKKQIVNFGIANDKKVSIFGKGSGDGFDISKFQQTSELQKKVETIGKEYKLKTEHIVLGYVGRLTKDKGIENLVRTFVKLNAKYSNLRLLIVGKYEDGDSIDSETRREIFENPNIIHTGYQKDPVPFFRLMDIFAFLTKREGFGNVSIEAALSGLPVIAANVTGAKDTIVDGRTGFLIDSDDQQDVAEKLELLILAPELRKKMGVNGQRWACQHFSNNLIWAEMEHFYQNALNSQINPTLEIK